MNNVKTIEAKNALITNRDLNDFGLASITDAVNELIAEANLVIEEGIEINKIVFAYFVNGLNRFAAHIADKDYWGNDLRPEFFQLAGAALVQRMRIEKHFENQK